jgi:hypothetical protein
MFIIWLACYAVQYTLFDEQFLDLVFIIVGNSMVFGHLGLSFLTAAAENAKEAPSQLIALLPILLSGLAFVFVYYPGAYAMQWTSYGFASSSSIILQLIRAVLFAVTFWVIIPLGYRMLKFIVVDWKSHIHIIAMLVLLFALGPICILTFVMIQAVSLAQMFMYLFFLTMALFFLVLCYFDIRHPTIFFSYSHGIMGLYIVEKESGLPAYHFNFVSREHDVDPVLLSAFVTGNLRALEEALESESEIESVFLGQTEVLVSEGNFVYAMLVANRGSSFLKALLNLVVEEFESYYGFQVYDKTGLQAFRAFDLRILRLFEFELPPPPVMFLEERLKTGLSRVAHAVLTGLYPVVILGSEDDLQRVFPALRVFGAPSGDLIIIESDEELPLEATSADVLLLKPENHSKLPKNCVLVDLESGTVTGGRDSVYTVSLIEEVKKLKIDSQVQVVQERFAHIEDGVILLQNSLSNLAENEDFKEFRSRWNSSERALIYDVLEARYEIYRLLSSLSKQIPPALLANLDQRLLMMDGRVLVAMEMQHDDIAKLRENVSIAAQNLIGSL